MAIILGRKGGGAGGGGGGPPSGAAGGDLGGSYPNPTLSAAKEAELDAAAAAAAAAQTTANAAVPKALYDANTVLAANSDDTPAALTMGASTILARLAAGNIKAASVAEVLTLLDVPTNAQAVLKTLFDANTVLAADSDNTPAAVTMGASTILARLASGNIKAATPAEILTLLQPPGTELNHVERTTDFNSTATSAATATSALVSGSITYDGATKIKLIISGVFGGTGPILQLFEDNGATDLGRFAQGPSTNGVGNFHREKIFTPTAGAKVYSARLWGSSGTVTVYSASSGTIFVPAFIRIERA